MVVYKTVNTGTVRSEIKNFCKFWREVSKSQLILWLYCLLPKVELRFNIYLFPLHHRTQLYDSQLFMSARLLLSTYSLMISVPTLEHVSLLFNSVSKGFMSWKWPLYNKFGNLYLLLRVVSLQLRLLSGT